MTRDPVLKKLIPSSGSQGFFQTPPKLVNQFDDDVVLKRMFSFYLPAAAQSSITNDLSSFGSLVLSRQVFDWVTDAERHPPTVTTHTTFGVPSTVLHTSHGWNSLQELGITEGIVAIAYDTPQLAHHARVYQFLKYHLWTGSNAIVTCPSAMTDGAARLLSRHIAAGELDAVQLRVFREAYRNLISRDPERAWTSGQWMTERSGGSDVRGTETVATYSAALASDGATDAEGMPLGPWLINGFKWFSSATDSQMAVLLAQTDAGLSAFFAPMRRAVAPQVLPASPSPSRPEDAVHALAAQESEFNGVSIQRLKSKLGTRALPTAELVLHDMRAWPLGAPGRGVAEIATVLNITRIHTAVSALGLWARGLAIARAYARVRRVDGGRLLCATPAHVAALAANTVRYAGLMHVAFFVVALLGASEHPSSFSSAPSPQLVPDLETAAALLRLLTPVAKAVCSKRAVAGLQDCTEALGGIGYLDDPADQRCNVARLLRDCAVLPIWEGTTDVMAADLVRVVKGRDGHAVRTALRRWIGELAKGWRDEGAAATLGKEMQELLREWAEQEPDALKFAGREMLERTAWLVGGALLLQDAERDGDGVAAEVARRWVAAGPGGAVSSSAAAVGRGRDWRNAAEWDGRIVFGAAPVTERGQQEAAAKL